MRGAQGPHSAPAKSQLGIKQVAGEENKSPVTSGNMMPSGPSVGGVRGKRDWKNCGRERGSGRGGLGPGAGQRAQEREGLPAAEPPRPPSGWEAGLSRPLSGCLLVACEVGVSDILGQWFLSFSKWDTGSASSEKWGPGWLRGWLWDQDPGEPSGQVTLQGPGSSRRGDMVGPCVAVCDAAALNLAR